VTTHDLMDNYTDPTALGLDERSAIRQPVLLRGEGRYSDDVSLPGQACAAIDSGEPDLVWNTALSPEPAYRGRLRIAWGPIMAAWDPLDL